MTSNAVSISDSSCKSAARRANKSVRTEDFSLVSHGTATAVMAVFVGIARTVFSFLRSAQRRALALSWAILALLACFSSVDFPFRCVTVIHVDLKRSWFLFCEPFLKTMYSTFTGVVLLFT